MQPFCAWGPTVVTVPVIISSTLLHSMIHINIYTDVTLSNRKIAGVYRHIDNIGDCVLQRYRIRIGRPQIVGRRGKGEYFFIKNK